MNLEEILLIFYNKFPKMEIQDYLKLIHQHTFGCEHLIKNSTNSFKYLENEWNNCIKSFDNNVFEPIGNGYSRFNLFNGKNNGYDINTIFKIFYGSANLPYKKNTTKNIEINLDILRKLTLEKKINLNMDQLNKAIKVFKKNSYAPIHHSKIFHKHYAPSYRVLAEQYIKYIDIINKLDDRINKNLNTIVAIDGKCGSGKTLLSNFIKINYDCNVIKMDDFFIPENLQNSNTYDENIDIDRFSEEVYHNLKNKVSFTYGVFDCNSQKISNKIFLKNKKLTIVEGSYSSCRFFEDMYDIKIFINIDSTTQIKRITERNGEKMSKIFANKWIPMENLYFEKYKIEKSADFILN